MGFIETDLKWAARKHPGDESLYDFGLVFQGAFVPFYTTKSGRVDKLIAAAKAAQPEPTPPAEG